MGGCEERYEIAFFDVETAVPTRAGQRFAILEFGSILVCPRKLVELHSYATLVRPIDLSLISTLSVRCNGINRESVLCAPTFSDIADKVYDILHGRIWAGHNIQRFDCARIREAFAEINRSPPEPKGIIDSLTLLTQRFGRRAGDMKMATLATYFKLGKQTHRSLDDVRMNLEVLKYCATVLFLESSLPDIFVANSWVSPNATTRSRSNEKSSCDRARDMSISSSNVMQAGDSISQAPSTKQSGEKSHPIFSLLTQNTEEAITNLCDSSLAHPDHFDMSSLIDQLNRESLQPDVAKETKTMLDLSEMHSPNVTIECCSRSNGFIEHDEISIPSIHASLVRGGSHKIALSHKGGPVQLSSSHLKVHFGVSAKFVDHAGQPRLSIVVDAPPSLCEILDACDNIAKRLSVESGSSSNWRSIVRENGSNSSTVRLHIPIAVSEDVPMYTTEMFQRESSGRMQRLVFDKVDVEELGTLLAPGTFVDAFFTLTPYNYMQNAGIRLVAQKFILHTSS